MNVNGIVSQFDPSQFKIDKSEDKENNPSFQEFLNNSLNGVNNLQVEAMKQNSLLATGEVENIHDVTIASENAKIAMDLTLAVRNKAVDAYREIMRMQV